MAPAPSLEKIDILVWIKPDQHQITNVASVARPEDLNAGNDTARVSLPLTKVVPTASPDRLLSLVMVLALVSALVLRQACGRPCKIGKNGLGKDGMITIRRAAERGRATLGWLDSRHSFSFGDYHDPRYMGFRSLRVINEDRVRGGHGFDTHPHRDFEILSYIVAGELQHRDSMGHAAVLRTGDVQRISAGTGIAHSEYNHSPTEVVHFLQIWIVPSEKGLRPDYSQRSFVPGSGEALTLAGSKDGTKGSILIHQDAALWIGRLGSGEAAVHGLTDGRAAWVQVIEGELKANGVDLGPGDGAAVEAEPKLEMVALAATHFLLFDLA